MGFYRGETEQGKIAGVDKLRNLCAAAPFDPKFRTSPLRMARLQVHVSWLGRVRGLDARAAAAVRGRGRPARQAPQPARRGHERKPSAREIQSRHKSKGRHFRRRAKRLYTKAALNAPPFSGFRPLASRVRTRRAELPPRLAVSAGPRRRAPGGRLRRAVPPSPEARGKLFEKARSVGNCLKRSCARKRRRRPSRRRLVHVSWRLWSFARISNDESSWGGT